MYKHLHALEFVGITFGMEVDCQTDAYKRFKDKIIYEEVIGCDGRTHKAYTVPYLALASIMREAGWIVSQNRGFQKITIDGLKKGEEIYVKYNDETIDFRIRSDQVWRDKLK